MVEVLRAARFHELRGITCGDFLSYAELWERARRARLPEFAPGDRVALVASTSLIFVQRLAAVWLRGGVPVCLPPPNRLAAPGGYRSQREAWLAACQARVVLEGDEWSEDDPIEPQPSRPDQLALVQFSSGTTLDPRPVGLTQANLLANTRAILSLFPGRLEDHSCVSWLPLYHDMGLIGGLLSAFVAQGNLTLLKPLQFAARPAQWLSTLSQTRATVSPVPTFALAHCLERTGDQEWEQLDLSFLQLLLVGAETIYPSTLERFLARFGPKGLRREALTPVYGLAEATLAVTFSPPGRGPRILERNGRRLVSVGPPVPGVELEIRDGQGDRVADGQVGEIFVHGPSVMLGYLNQPPLQGWLDTGDQGFLAEGELYLTGRSRDVVILNGRNHSAEAIEQALSRVEGLEPSRAAAFSVGDPERGSERLVLLAEPPRHGEQDPLVLARSAREAVAEATRLLAEVRVLPSGSLPRTTSGKVRRGRCRELYQQGAWA